MKSNILIILSFALIMDLIIPFLIAPCYLGYRHSLQVMSVLGNNRSPLRVLYNAWLVVLGIILLIGNTVLFGVFAKYSSILASIFVVVITIYAIGGCILSGLFAVGETKSLTTISEKIHGFGSVIGFMILLFAPLICSLYWLKMQQISFVIFSILCFILAILFFVLFIMADKPSYQNTIIVYGGIWQRLTLLFMYLPIISICIFSK